MDMSETGKLGEKIVLCGANAYEQKYYFNPRFSKIPQSVQDELHIICVLFTREVGGIFTIVFEEDGTLAFETNAADDERTSDCGNQKKPSGAFGIPDFVLSGFYSR